MPLLSKKELRVKEVVEYKRCGLTEKQIIEIYKDKDPPLTTTTYRKIIRESKPKKDD